MVAKIHSKSMFSINLKNQLIKMQLQIKLKVLTCNTNDLISVYIMCTNYNNA
jgi:hypothetical protein